MGRFYATKPRLSHPKGRAWFSCRETSPDCLALEGIATLLSIVHYALSLFDRYADRKARRKKEEDLSGFSRNPIPNLCALVCRYTVCTAFERGTSRMIDLTDKHIF